MEECKAIAVQGESLAVFEFLSYCNVGQEYVRVFTQTIMERP